MHQRKTCTKLDSCYGTSNKIRIETLGHGSLAPECPTACYGTSNKIRIETVIGKVH